MYFISFYGIQSHIDQKKTIVADFSWINEACYQKLFSCLPDAMQMRFVGGCVRNTLLGIPFEDVDFATSYRPEEITYFFEKNGYKVIPTGLQHGTVSVLLHGHTYEITTLRRDVETDGRHAIIAYTPIWAEDAKRRDFTMNALYVDHRGSIYDDVGGQQDIAQKLIRFIGDPEQRIREDYLRILRFFRFWALYGDHGDDTGLESCVRMKNHLEKLSSERITKEMLKLLSAHNPWPILEKMYQHDFETLIWGHIGQNFAIKALERLEKNWGPASLWVRLALLTGQMPERLTLSREQKKHLHILWTPMEEDLRTSVYDYGISMTQERLWMCALKALSAYNDNASENFFSIEQDLILQSYKKKIHDLNHQLFPDFPLSGKDLIALGISGPKIGHILKKTKQWWIQQNSEPNQESCMHYVHSIQSK